MVRTRMRTTRRRDTPAELALRRELHRRGLRFLVDHQPVTSLKTRADLVFRGARIAVFVDGCFWHACPEHATWPRTNAAWWREKIEANVARDRRADGLLLQEGWAVIRVWEHEEVQSASDRVQAAVQRTP